MTATKLFPSGAWEVSDIIAGHRVHRTYYGYSKREALRQFRAEVPRPPQPANLSLALRARVITLR